MNKKFRVALIPLACEFACPSGHRLCLFRVPKSSIKGDMHSNRCFEKRMALIKLGVKVDCECGFEKRVKYNIKNTKEIFAITIPTVKYLINKHILKKKIEMIRVL